MKKGTSRSEVAQKDLSVIWWAIKMIAISPIKLLSMPFKLQFKAFLVCLILFAPMVLALCIKIVHRVFKILTNWFNYLQLRANTVINLYQRQ